MKIESLFEKSRIKFDKNNHTILSKSKLIWLIKNATLEGEIIERKKLSSEFYILVDSNLVDFYFIEKNELIEWKTDGSFEKNDTLYKATLIENID